MTKHFVTVETILTIEGDLTMSGIIDNALREIRNRAERRDMLLQIENGDCTKQWSFQVKGEKITPICRQCGSPLKPDSLCPDETCPFSDGPQNRE
jgi:hypothetical protein